MQPNAKPTSHDAANKPFLDGPIQDVRWAPLNPFADQRGWLAELFRNDELPRALHPQMAYVSQTLPGVVRGPHEHEHQSDLFGFFGPSDFELHLWDARLGSPTYWRKQILVVGQSNMASVMIPPGVVHAYKNIGTLAGLVFNSPNRLYAGSGKTERVDEIRHEEDPNTPFILE